MNSKEPHLKDVDVVIVSVLIDTEHPSLLATFGIEPFSEPKEQIENFKFWFTELKTKEGKNLKVALTCFGDKGNIDSTLFTKSLLNITHPKSIYLVGSAIGRKDKVSIKVSICDVVVSSRGIMYYEPGRVKKGGVGSKLPYVYPKPELRNEVEFFYTSRMKSLRWQEEYKSTFKKLKKKKFLILSDSYQRSPKVHFEVIASGEKLLDKKTFEVICKHDERIYAGEMEGYGFAKACDDSNINWLVIRGVSDFGERKTKEKNKLPATAIACSFLKILLQNPFQPPTQIKTLPEQSLYVREKIPDIMRKLLKEKSIDITPIKFSLDLTINELEHLCHILYPDIPISKLKKTLRMARATAFEKKYAARNEEDDERFIDIERWKAEFRSLLFYLDIKDLKERRIINVGIGNGLEGKGLFDDINNFTGVDISRKALEYAKKYFPQMQCIVNDAEDLSDIVSNSQDLYISLRTYQSTLFDIKAALLEAYRVLRAGGIIFISIPYIFIGENKSIVNGLLLPESNEVDPDLPYILVDKVRRGLNLLNFDRIGIRTGMVEVYVYGQRGR